MDDAKELLEHARAQAPAAPFDLEDVRVRRGRRARLRRISATAVGLGLTVAIVAGAASIVRSGAGGVPIAHGDGLPAPVRTVPLDLGGYSYQRIRLEESCGNGCGVSPELHVESWWAPDGSGRIDVLAAHDYGIQGGTFGPGAFPDEGDLSGFPTDPDALRSFLLRRSGPNGASPRPEVTPTPGVPLEDGQLWLAIRDYLGSTQYLNTTPELRAAMLQVLARDPMVDVDPGATDPLGRQATALRFHAYDADVNVFVDPTTDDFLAMTRRTQDGSSETLVVEAAGIASTDHARPDPRHSTVPSPA